jgi:hypothetical protein
MSIEQPPMLRDQHTRKNMKRRIKYETIFHRAVYPSRTTGILLENNQFCDAKM